MGVFLWARYLMSFVLLPLVFPLGRKVRNTIFRMPEAPGKREGIVGSGTPIFVQKVHQYTQKTVEWHILGKKGIRMVELLPIFGDKFPEEADLSLFAWV